MLVSLRSPGDGATTSQLYVIGSAAGGSTKLAALNRFLHLTLGGGALATDKLRDRVSGGVNADLQIYGSSGMVDLPFCEVCSFCKRTHELLELESALFAWFPTS